MTPWHTKALFVGSEQQELDKDNIHTTTHAQTFIFEPIIVFKSEWAASHAIICETRQSKSELNLKKLFLGHLNSDRQTDSIPLNYNNRWLKVLYIVR